MEEAPMSACVQIPTLNTLVVVQDPNPAPKSIFAVTEDHKGKTTISQYVRISCLPEELREAVRNSVWD
jgi:hypothetical protein